MVEPLRGRRHDAAVLRADSEIIARDFFANLTNSGKSGLCQKSRLLDAKRGGGRGREDELVVVAAQQEAALTGGDDYELVFTAPPSAALRIEQAGLLTKTRLTRIGKICEKVSGDNLTVRSQNGGIVTTPTQGFDHFAA